MDIERSEKVSMASSAERRKFPTKAVFVATFVAISGAWHVGFSIGSVNAAYAPVVSFIRSEYERRFQRNVSSELVDAIWVATSAIFPIGGLVGSFCVGLLVKRFGRLKSILYSHITVALMSVLLGSSKVLGSPELILIARFGLGFTSGAMGKGICPMYVAEVSPKHLRGVLGGLIGTGLTMGIFGANALGIPSLLSNDDQWPILLALAGGPSFLFILLFPTLLDSPRELFLEKDDPKKATEVLQKLHGTNDVGGILSEMAEEKEASRFVTQLSTLQVLRSRRFTPSVITASILASAQQLSGIDGISFNMNNAFLKAGLSYEIVPYAAIGVTGTLIVLHFASAIMMEKFGRKFLICLGYSIEAVSLIMVTIFMQIQHYSNILPYLTVVASMGFYCGFSLGGGPVTHVIIPELFDQASRSAGIVVSSAFLWVSFTACVIATPYMLTAIGGFTFLVFCTVAIATVIFTFRKVPETKNKPFHEIKGELANKFSFSGAI